MRMKERECAFCKGTGSDPFNLLSKLAACQVCGGAGIVQVEEPAIGCIFCRGTGVYPHNGRVTCTVCKGKGMVTVKGSKGESVRVSWNEPESALSEDEELGFVVRLFAGFGWWARAQILLCGTIPSARRPECVPCFFRHSGCIGICFWDPNLHAC